MPGKVTLGEYPCVLTFPTFDSEPFNKTPWLDAVKDCVADTLFTTGIGNVIAIGRIGLPF